MQDALYSETSPSDTGLVTLTVQSSNTTACLLCILLEIVNVTIR